VRDQQQKLLSGWVSALAPVLFPQAQGFALDFHRHGSKTAELG
jgi:hypothetical protein